VSRGDSSGAILSAMKQTGSPMSMKRISEMSGLPYRTAVRVIGTLVDQQLVERASRQGIYRIVRAAPALQFPMSGTPLDVLRAHVPPPSLALAVTVRLGDV
jgi:DNA-binding IclR family transcriptional regulator